VYYKRNPVSNFTQEKEEFYDCQYKNTIQFTFSIELSSTDHLAWDQFTNTEVQWWTYLVREITQLISVCHIVVYSDI
jgi:hypothetical protein